MATQTTEKQEQVAMSDSPHVGRAATADTFTTAPTSSGPVTSTDFASQSPAPAQPTEPTTRTESGVPAPILGTGAVSSAKPHPHVDTTTARPPAIDTGTSAAATATEAGPRSSLSARSTGLAAALESSGHSITKVDARNLKQEIKNEKEISTLLANEEKAEAREITAALVHAKACVKDVTRCAKLLDAARKKLTGRVEREAKAKKAFLKAEEALKEATARSARAKEEMDVATARHTAAVATKEASDIRVEQLRKHKGTRDVEREQKRAEAINKMSDAERALTASGYQKRFGCF